MKRPRHAVRGPVATESAGRAAVWRKVFRALFVADLVVVGALAGLIIHDLLVGRAVGALRGPTVVLVVLAVGQLGLWVGYRSRWIPGRQGRPKGRRRTISPPFPTTRSGVAGAVALSLVVVGGFVQAYLAYRSPIMRVGGPDTATSSCRWALDNHGTVTCVSHAAYITAVSEVQRFVLGIAVPFYGFFGLLMADALSPSRPVS